MVIRISLIVLGVISLVGMLLLVRGSKKSVRNNEDGRNNNSKKNQLHNSLNNALMFRSIIGNSLKESPQSSWLYDYSQYPMSLMEKFSYTLLAGAALFTIGYIFYQSIIGALFLTPIGLIYPSYKRKEKITQQKKQLALEFRDALYTISSSLTVGKSIEASIKGAIKELELLYPINDNFIIKELQYINRKIEMNETIENAFMEFANRSHLEDIESFADILITCKRTGGNLIEVIKNTSKMISEKIEFQQDLELMLTKRKFEQKFLAVIPVMLVLVLSWSAPDYMAPIFSTLIGRMVMTFAILLFSLSMFIANKIIKIEV